MIITATKAQYGMRLYRISEQIQVQFIKKGIDYLLLFIHCIHAMVGSHSLRAGGAMALKFACANRDDQKVGQMEF